MKQVNLPSGPYLRTAQTTRNMMFHVALSLVPALLGAIYSVSYTHLDVYKRQVEAIEMPSHPFAIGVQWHPESMYRTSPEMRELFGSFILRAAA